MPSTPPNLYTQFLKHALAGDPFTLRAANGDDIEFGVQPADMPTDPSSPVIFVDFAGSTPPSIRHDRVPVDVPVSVVGETFAFADGTTIYQVVERDILSIEEIRATVGGTPSTVIPSNEYRTASTEFYVTKDAVEFLGPTFPDDATSVAIDYTHRTIRFDSQSRYNIMVRLTLRVPRIAAGEHGSTIDRTIPSVTAVELEDSLKRYLTHRQGMDLWPVGEGAQEEGSMHLGPAISVGKAPMPEDRSFSEHIIDVQVGRFAIEEGTAIKAAGDFTSDVTLNDEDGNPL